MFVRVSYGLCPVLGLRQRPSGVRLLRCSFRSTPAIQVGGPCSALDRTWAHTHITIVEQFSFLRVDFTTSYARPESVRVFPNLPFVHIITGGGVVHSDRAVRFLEIDFRFPFLRSRPAFFFFRVPYDLTLLLFVYPTTVKSLIFTQSTGE